jgi:aminomethyltransferase
MTQLLRTPLYPVYEKYGAKTIAFGGWELPVHFTGIQEEHDAVRERAGLFDASHMGEIIVAGEDAETFLQHVTTNDVTRLKPHQGQYTLMCYPDGGTVDDLILFKFTDQRFMLVVNAANTQKDLDWLKKHAPADVAIKNISGEIALLALQGPRAADILQKLTDAPVKDLPGFCFLPEVMIGEVKAMVSRTGYTGEEGFELYVHRDDAVTLWEALLQAGRDDGLLPAGLGARDTLRFEARLPLYGQELSADISPVEAGLGFFVKLEKGGFIGREALEKQKLEGPRKKLVGLEMVERGIPRTGYAVYADGRRIGEITTGTRSPTLKKNIGLAVVDRAYAALDTEVEVDIRGKRLKAKVVKTPFYSRKRKETQA